VSERTRERLTSLAGDEEAPVQAVGGA
jgi:hypothetical protein